MKVVKAVLTALLIVIIVLLAIFLTVAIGYYFGILLTVLPFVSGWLTSALPITAGQIPAITAWMAVAGVFIGGGAKVSANMDGGDAGVMEAVVGLIVAVFIVAPVIVAGYLAGKINERKRIRKIIEGVWDKGGDVGK